MKILYVLGRGRSGSTIFANVLGAYEGYFAAGEVRYLWDPVVTRDRACACGQPVSRCPVWSHVLERVGTVDAQMAGAWQREVVTERNLLRLLRYDRPGRWPALDNYASLMAEVYRALGDVTGSRVIVDSSKRPSYAAFARLLRGSHLYCIHLVRDPRASAYSWATSRHGSVFGDTEVRRRNSFDSTIRWNVLNLEAELLLRRLPRDRWMRLRYEDFVAAPRAQSERVARLTGDAPPESPFRDDRTVALASGHTIAGNPSRLATGEVTIEDRDQWRSEQRALDRVMATAVAVPFLGRYGYGVRSASAASSTTSGT